MLTLRDYFGPREGHPEATDAMRTNAGILLERVNGLLEEAALECTYSPATDPDTGTCVSGSKGGSGDGGFRVSTSTTGAPNSLHKRAQAVDIYDPGNLLDNWISLFETPEGGNTLLERHGLYREHPSYTHGWCHLQSVQPRSGKRTFKP